MPGLLASAMSVLDYNFTVGAKLAYFSCYTEGEALIYLLEESKKTCENSCGKSVELLAGGAVRRNLLFPSVFRFFQGSLGAAQHHYDISLFLGNGKASILGRFF